VGAVYYVKFRDPITRQPLSKTGAVALIAYFKEKQAEDGARRVKAEDITVGAWIEKFTAIENSPRTGVNASRNRLYSPGTVETYRGYYNAHTRGDPFALLKMAEVEESRPRLA
jgi:hypothetical protein